MAHNDNINLNLLKCVHWRFGTDSANSRNICLERLGWCIHQPLVESFEAFLLLCLCTFLLKLCGSTHPKTLKSRLQTRSHMLQIGLKLPYKYKCFGVLLPNQGAIILTNPWFILCLILGQEVDFDFQKSAAGPK